MELALAALVVIVGAAVFLLRRSSRPARAAPVRTKVPSTDRSNKQGASTLYQAVAIMTPKACCGSASELEGRRYLVREAPKLPLATCDESTCKCGYMRYPDRRDDEGDRRGPPGLKSELFALNEGEDRRSTRGRRWADFSLA
jgi:hypothetical protein